MLFAMLVTVSGAAAFTAPMSRGVVPQHRTVGPTMLFGLGQKEEALPAGWKKVKSVSRPGEFSYENLKTGQRYNSIPPSLLRRSGSEFYDDEQDTTAKPFWQIGVGSYGNDSESFADKARNIFAEKTSSSDLEAYYKRGGKASKDSITEASGFAANGEDLATVGGVYYLATVPFLLFFVAYIFGGVGSPYGNGGNFS